MIFTTTNPQLTIEFLSTFLIFIINLAIFLKTKEIYQLTNHTGIKYFRRAFLFFAISNYFSLLLILFWNPNLLLFTNAWFYLAVFALPSIYFELLALFQLLYSLMWKKYQNKDYYITKLLYIFPIAILITITIAHNILYYIIAQTTIFILIFIISYSQYKLTRKKKGLPTIYIIYMSLCVTFLINEFILISPFQLPNYIKIFDKTIIIAIFLFILYKVHTELKLPSKRRKITLIRIRVKKAKVQPKSQTKTK